MVGTLPEIELRDLFQRMAMGVVFQNESGFIVAANPAAETILGLSLDEMQGRSSIDPRWKSIHEDGSAFPGETHPAMAALRTGQVIKGVIMGVYDPRSGQYRWIEIDAFPQFRPAVSRPFQVYTTFTDITAKRQAQEDLKQRTSFLELILHVVPANIMVVDLEGCFHYINRRWPGQTDDQLELVNFLDLVHPAYRAEASRIFQRAIATGAMQTGEYLSLNEIAMYRWVEVTHSPIFLDGRVQSVLSFVLDIHDRKLAADELRQEQEKLSELNRTLEARVLERTAEARQLYDQAPCGYHSVDENGIFLMVNQTELDWLGYAREELVGLRSVRSVIAPADLPKFDAAFANLKKIGDLRELELDYCRKDGTLLPLLLNSTVVYDETGRYRMSRTTTFDITERRKTMQALRDSEERLQRSAQELRQANAALEKAIHLKDEFLANMSHELRTPLNGILGLTEILLGQMRGPLNDYQRKYMHLIDASGKHLLEIVSDLLDMSSLEAGRLVLHPGPVMVDLLCREALAALDGKARDKSIQLAYTPGPADLKIMGVWRVKQILANLLDNAVKFTPRSGQVNLTAGLGPDGRNVFFRVCDTGIGIAAGDQQRIFEPFTQVDGGINRQAEGTGLGLALARKLAVLQGGTLEVQSAFGQGSCFTLWLPCFQPPDQLAAPRLLLVEGDEKLRIPAAQLLERSGFNLEVAASGHEALARLDQLAPDLLVMSLSVQTIENLETIRAVRANPRRAATLILAVSASGQADDCERSLEAGASDFLSCPTDPETLLRRIHLLLE
jgi:PAS domain S-box-containing protein